MTTRILLTGMNSFDSGKTQLALKLAKAYSDSGLSVEYFKPLSGHNYWYNYEHSKVCMERGVLTSKDAIIVRKVIEPKSPIEIANPIHNLFVPMRLEKPLQTLPNSFGLSGSSSILTMERFSRPIGNKIDSTVLVAMNLLEEDRLLIGYDDVGKLTKETSIIEINNLQELQEFENLNYEQYVSESFEYIENLADVVIIEGFNDAAWPWDELESSDIVLVVGPGHVFSYDPERFRKAAYLMKRGNLPIREVTFSRISDLLRPTNRIEVKPETDISTFEMKELGIDCYTGKKD
ncbi:MAG: hypothetical protein ACFFDM_08055 [Candidatus Thorarchaeota archaeon]